MTLRLRGSRLLALLLIVTAQLGATPTLASTTPAPAASSAPTATASTPVAAPTDTASTPVAAPTDTPTPSSALATTASATATVSLTATLTPTTPTIAPGTPVTGTASAMTDAYTLTVPLSGTPSATTARLLVRRSATMRMQAVATGAGAPTITAVLFTGSAANPTITITGVGFGAPSAPETPGCGGFIPNNGSVYPDMAIGDNDPTHGFYAGGPGSCIGLVNLSYSDTRISYQFGAGYADYRGLYTLGQGDSYSLGVKGASFCGRVDYSGRPAANTCPPTPSAPTPVVGAGRSPGIRIRACASPVASMPALTSPTGMSTCPPAT